MGEEDSHEDLGGGEDAEPNGGVVDGEPEDGEATVFYVSTVYAEGADD
ncbi:MAG: hypothetical protein AAFZ17_21215 [Cyanobacteria bacterium J06650_10]